jgi:hypothetical protein
MVVENCICGMTGGCKLCNPALHGGFTEPPQQVPHPYQIVPAPTPIYGWSCPKCQKVWSPFVSGCISCNSSSGGLSGIQVTNNTEHPIVVSISGSEKVS